MEIIIVYNVYLYLENWKVIFYTAQHEDFKKIFFKTVNRDICNVVFDIDWFGMDDANNVHDEIFIKVRHRCQ